LPTLWIVGLKRFTLQAMRRANSCAVIEHNVRRCLSV